MSPRNQQALGKVWKLRSSRSENCVRVSEAVRIVVLSRNASQFGLREPFGGVDGLHSTAETTENHQMGAQL